MCTFLNNHKTFLSKHPYLKLTVYVEAFFMFKKVKIKIKKYFSLETWCYIYKIVRHCAFLKKSIIWNMTSHLAREVEFTCFCDHGIQWYIVVRTLPSRLYFP